MIYRDRLKGWYMVARNVFLLLLNCSTWPFLGPPSPLYIQVFRDPTFSSEGKQEIEVAPAAKFRACWEMVLPLLFLSFFLSFCLSLGARCAHALLNLHRKMGVEHAHACACATALSQSLTLCHLTGCHKMGTGLESILSSTYVHKGDI